MASIIQRPQVVQSGVSGVVYVIAAAVIILGVGAVVLRTTPVFEERSSQIVPARPLTADIALTPTNLSPQ